MTIEELQTQLQLANDESKNGNYAEAERLATDILTITGASPGLIESEWIQLRAAALCELGIVALRRGESSPALDLFNSSLALSERIFDRSGIAKSMHGIGNVYSSLSDYSRALEYFAKALANHEELGEKSDAAQVTGSIGNVYNYLSDFPLALEYYFTSLAAYEELGEKRGVARVTGNIGIVYRSLSDYPLALEYFSKALAVHEELGNKSSAAIVTVNIGLVYSSLGDYPRALEYYSKALEAHEELGMKSDVARVTVNIGIVYSSLGDYHRALEYYLKALAIHEELGNKSGAARVKNNIGLVYNSLADYPRALEYFTKALAIHQETGEKRGVAVVTGNIGLVYSSLADYPRALEYFTKALATHQEIGEKSGIAQVTGNIGSLFGKRDFDGFDAAQAEEYLLKAVSASEEIGYRHYLYTAYKSLSDLYELIGREADALTYFKKFYELEKEVQSEEAKKQAERIDYERKQAEREKQIATERARAQEKENILNNILPEEITTRLIKGENPIADQFNSVSILFMDIVEFTKLSTTITAQQLVYLLNTIFIASDGVMREYGLEKIKTIGDAYMAVAGAPVVQEDHAHRAAAAALELLHTVQNLVVEFPAELGDRSWIESIPEIQVRIGLHCGPVAAGVVGENKFLYDLWGDAVNTASRMESHGEAGKIHCTEDFMRSVRESITLPLQMRFVERGEIDIKGKGMMRTYFLEGA